MTNEVELSGRLTRDPEERVLPSGDRVVGLRLSVPHARAAATGGNWVDCALWTVRTQKSALAWQQGDEVWVQGGLQRRFYRTRGVPQFLLEVVVSRARLVRRARSA